MPAMVVIVPFQPEHLAALRLQAVQASAQPMMNEQHGRDILASAGVAYTALEDGRPVAVAGITELWKGRGMAWAYLSDMSAAALRVVHRAVLRVLSERRWRRVEAAIDPRYTAGKRWAMHLGFERECLAPRYSPDDRDIELWARVAPRLIARAA